MKFIAYDHYDDNGYLMSEFSPACPDYIFNEWPVIVTTAGIAFFSLHKSWTKDEKIAFARHLHRTLAENSGQGLSAVACGVSVSAQAKDFDAIFRATRAIDPAIRTIAIIQEHQPASDWADISVIDTLSANNSDLIAGAVQSGEADKAMPAQGWDAYKAGLEAIYTTARHRTGAELDCKRFDNHNPRRPPILIQCQADTLKS